MGVAGQYEHSRVVEEEGRDGDSVYIHLYVLRRRGVEESKRTRALRTRVIIDYKINIRKIFEAPEPGHVVVIVENSQVLRVSGSQVLRFSDSQVLRFSDSQILGRWKKEQFALISIRRLAVL